MKLKPQIGWSNIMPIVVACITFSSCYYHNTDKTPLVVAAPLPGSWDKLGDFEGIPRISAMSFTIGNYAYVGTGFNEVAKSYLNDLWRYDATTDVWQRMADFPGPGRHSAVAFVLNDRAYVGTGTGNNINGLSDFYEFDPSIGPHGSWKQVADLDSMRYGAVAFVVKNRAFVGTGIANKNLKGTADFWEYDQPNNKWIKRQDFIGEPRFYAFVMTMYDRAFIGGGLKDNLMPEPSQYPVKLEFCRFEVDGLANGEPWISLPLIDVPLTNPQPAQRASSVVFCDYQFGYLVDGFYTNPSGIYPGTWRYDPTKNSWTTCFSYVNNVPVRGEARRGAAGFMLGGYGYVVCGGNASSSLDDVWKFDPNGVEPDHR